MEIVMRMLFSMLFGLFFFVGCATVGATIEGGKKLTTGVIDATVDTAAGLSSAVLEDTTSMVGTVADATQGVVETVRSEVDKQTDELQEPEGK